MILVPLALAIAGQIAGQAAPRRPTLLLCPLRDRASILAWGKTALNLADTDVIGLKTVHNVIPEVAKYGRAHSRQIAQLYFFASPGGGERGGALKPADDNQIVDINAFDTTQLDGTRVERIEITTEAACTPSRLARIAEKWSAKEVASWTLQRVIRTVGVSFGKKLTKSESEAKAASFRRTFTATDGVYYGKQFLAPGMPQSVDELAKMLVHKRAFTFVYEVFTSTQVFPRSATFHAGNQEGEPYEIVGVPISEGEQPPRSLSVQEALTTRHDDTLCASVPEQLKLRRVVVSRP